MASKTFYECGCMEQGDQFFACGKHHPKAVDSPPPATPVESPDENWFQRQARLAARDVQLLPPWLRSHHPAVSGEGERLKEQAAAYRAIALDALACWQGEDEHSDDNQRRNRSARSRATLRHRICAVDDTVRASTPTPGAPQ